MADSLAGDHPINIDEMPSSPSSSSSREGEGRAESGPVSLSPPHSCTDSSATDPVPAEEGSLFSLRVNSHDGTILASSIFNETAFDPQELAVGRCFFRSLLGNSQSFFLSAAIGSTRQRLFSRIKSGRMSHACELLCEFSPSGIARVSAFALRSAYEPSAGPLAPLTFTTKHAANCALTHIDLSCIPYLGHLPTDLIGRSLLSFVYAPDVHIIRQAHLDLHASRGRVVRSSASLRFVAFNGSLVRAETEWSAYVNPWSRRIELVVARHRIVDAPIGDANVLGLPAAGTQSLLPSPLVRIFEEEMRSIMAKPIPSTAVQRHSAAAAQQLQQYVQQSQQALPLPQKDIPLYIDRLVENFVVNGTSRALEQHEEAVKAAVKQELISGESPSGTGSGTEAALCDFPLPLSYNQINCLENVHRLLKSQSRLEEVMEDGKAVKTETRETAAIPLTRESLQLHTRKFEAEYRATWSRRLSSAAHKRALVLVEEHTHGRLSELSPPAAKQARQSTSSTPAWTTSQREEYYRSLAPNPAPPAGLNFHITSMPLPSAEAVAAAVAPRRSAFTSVARPLPETRHFSPLTISTGESPLRLLPSGPAPSSVIKTAESTALLVPLKPTL